MKKKVSPEKRNELLLECRKILTPHFITFDIPDVIGDSRASDLHFTRAIIAYVLKQKGYSLAMIGAVLGGRDHATALNLLNYHKKRIGRDDRYARIIGKLSRELEADSNEAMIAYHEGELARLRAIKPKKIA